MQEPSEIVGDPRHGPTGMLRKPATPQHLDLAAQRASDTLVGIQAKHPVVGSVLDGELLLRTVPRPIALNDPGPQRTGNLASRIRRMGVNHNDFVTKADGAQARLDPIRLVE